VSENRIITNVKMRLTFAFCLFILREALAQDFHGCTDDGAVLASEA
jgi:hypothetical protein